MGGGDFMTQAFPTNFHTFHTRKVLTPSERPEDWRLVTAAERAQLEEQDAKTQAEAEMFERIKRPLFDDMWLTAMGEYGSIDHSLAEPYIAEGIGHTYEDALYMLKFGVDGYGFPYAGYNYYDGKVLLIRNNSWGGLPIGAWAFCFCPNLRVIRFVNNYKISNRNNFNHCEELEYVYGIIQYDVATPGTPGYYYPFYQSPKLKHIELTNLSADITFEKCPELDLESFRFMVEKAIKAITITVHPDVYAKLTDREGHPDWWQLKEDAAAKQISFAVT